LPSEWVELMASPVYAFVAYIGTVLFYFCLLIFCWNSLCGVFVS
jgi:hypothetical protein